MSLAAGTTLGSYTIERLVGRGGMGEVYLAVQAGLDRRVALKLLSPELAADPSFRDRFVAESRVAASLDHPHIVPIFEAGEAGGHLFLAMRYVDGSDLEAILAQGPLEPDDAHRILAGVASALDAAHQRGLVHRDVKPGNILVGVVAGGPPHAYLGDFGLAKDLGSDAGLTRSGQLVGSVAYVAPEQIQGEPIDGRADGYALAGVLFAALTGQPPYRRDTDMATLWAHVQAPPPRPSAVDERLARFDAVFERGMAKAPADRFATASELVAAFAEAAGAPAAGDGTGGDRDLDSSVGATPISSMSGTPSPAIGVIRMPHPLSSFVGRESELADLAGRIGPGRIVTLTGPGGTGKTRLAIRAATDLAGGYADGATFVDLAATTDPGEGLAEIASSLDLDERSGSSIEALVAALAGRSLLLVLDNLENVVAIAPAIGRLLDGCPDLAVVATSRIPLHLRAETEVPVQPLDVPSRAAPVTLEGAATSSAVLLFAARAASARADFALSDRNAAEVASICRRVDGLPLAIELAAARVRILSPGQILARLDASLAILTGGDVDLPERQRTLRSTIAWSHDLLDEPARILFRRLAVFEGGLTFEDAQAVCPDLAPDVYLESMTTLVDGSLLSRQAAADDEPRFAMLETIREFAAEQLDAAGERDEAARRHLERFAALGRRFATEQTAATLDGWFDRLDRDRANLVAAIARGPRLGAGARASAADLLSSLIDYLRARWHSGTVRALLDGLLAEDALGDQRRGPLLHEAASHAIRQGDFAAAERFAEEFLAIARRRGDHHGAVGAGHVLAVAAAERGDPAAESRHVAALIEDADRSGEARMQVVARSHVALLALRRGDFAEAARRYDEIVETMRRIEVMQESLGTAFFNRGLAELHAGRLDAAAASLAESAAIARSMDDRDLLGYGFEGYAALAIALDRPALAARFQGAAAAALAEAGSELEGFEAAMRDRTSAAARSALGDATFEVERVAGSSAVLGVVLDEAIEVGKAVAPG